MARLAGIEGMNLIRLRFDADWTAESIAVVLPSGNASLDISACSTAVEVTFEPAPCSRLRLPVHADIFYGFTRETSASPDIGDEFLAYVERVRVWTE